MKKQRTTFTTELTSMPAKLRRGGRAAEAGDRAAGEPAPRAWAQGFDRPLA